MKKIIIALILAISLASCSNQEIGLKQETKQKTNNFSEKDNSKSNIDILFNKYGKGKYEKFLSINNGIISAVNNKKISYLDLDGNKIINNIKINGIIFEEFGKTFNNLGKIKADNKINFINNKGEILFGDLNDISTWGEENSFGKKIIKFSGKGDYFTYNIIKKNGTKILDKNFYLRRAGGDLYLLREEGKYPQKFYIYNKNNDSLDYLGNKDIYMKMTQKFLLYFSLSKGELAGIDKKGNKTILLGKDTILKYDFNKVLNFYDVNGKFTYIFKKYELDKSDRVNYSFLPKINSNKVILAGYDKYNIYDTSNMKFIFNNFDKYKIFKPNRTDYYGWEGNENRFIPLKLKMKYASSDDFGTYPLYIDEDVGENIPYLKSNLIYAHSKEDMDKYFIKQYYMDLENGQYENVYKKTNWESGNKSFKKFVGWYKGLKKVDIISIKSLKENKYEIELKLFYEGKNQSENIKIIKKIKEKYGRYFLETVK